MPGARRGAARPDRRHVLRLYGRGAVRGVVKWTKRGTPEGAHIEAARNLGKLDVKPWVLVTGKAGTPRAVATLDFAAFVSLAHAAGLVPEVTGVLPVSIDGSPRRAARVLPAVENPQIARIS